MTVPRVECEAKPVWLVGAPDSEAGEAGSAGDVDVAAWTTPMVANAPFRTLSLSNDTSQELTSGDLTPGVEYKLVLLPEVYTESVRATYKCAASGGSISSLTDGDIIFGNMERRICLPPGSTKLRVFVKRDPSTPKTAYAMLYRTDE